jgi:hypothetical protein
MTRPKGRTWQGGAGLKAISMKTGMTPVEAMRIVLSRVPPADQARIARFGNDWEVCHCDERIEDMRQRHVWGVVTCEKGKWWFHVDPQVFNRLPAAARVGLMAHELGHAACYRGGDGTACYGSEEAADANVRRWGFDDELAALYEAAGR